MNELKSMTPKQIVEELDKYIIGQESAKKTVAVALRSRYRRNMLPDEMREEITPKNILMIGPTGCGKTEIARRLSKLMDAPFVKVEATKFTEVGYVGRDVDSIIRSLVEASVRLTKQKMMEEKYKIADEYAEEILVDALVPGGDKKKNAAASGTQAGSQPASNPINDLLKNIPGLSQYLPAQMQQQMQQMQQQTEAVPEPQENTPSETERELAKDQVRQQLKDGLLEEQFIEIDVTDNSANTNMFDIGGETMSISIGNIFGDKAPKRKKKKRMKVKDARKILREEEAQKLIDQDVVVSEAIENAEQNGIVFIDEIDKIASESGYGKGANVSREGVQRDILPIVEGSVVNTKYGPVKTDHMLFIGAGAFHISKPTDLIPELQGRFPVRVELENLSREDFIKILTQPKNALIKQHEMLLGTEGVNVTFSEDAIEEIAEIAFITNEQTENIGARRLHTIMEKLVEDLSYELPDPEKTEIVIDKAYVEEKFIEKINADDIDKYIL